MSLYPSLEDLKVDQLAKAQAQAYHNAAYPASSSYPAVSAQLPSAPPSYGMNPTSHPVSGNKYARLYPMLDDYMGLQLPEHQSHVPANTSNAVAISQISVPAVKSSTMVAPISSTNPGLARAQVTHGLREITLCKDGKGKVGLRVQAINKGVFVILVQKGTPAALAGLRFGDQILIINDVTVAGFSVDDVHKLIKKSDPNKITMVVRDRPFERAITVHKDSLGTVGFGFKNGKIINIVKDSSAARNGVLIDHNLLEVNGQNVVGLKDKDISAIIKQSPSPITVTIMPNFVYEHMIKKTTKMSLRKTLHSRERNIVNNVRMFFEKEAQSGVFCIPIQKAQERTAAATGVSIRTIQRIRKESAAFPDKKLSTPGKKRIRPAERNLDMECFDLCVVRNTIYKLYAAKKMPTLPTLLPVLQDKIGFSWKRESLRKVLYQIGFHWKRCHNYRKLLIERPDIISWRCQYLREIKKYHESQKNIVYVDETWIDTKLSFSKCWRDEKNGAVLKDSVGKRLIVVHAGSKEGFVPNAGLVYEAGCTTGDYHGLMNCENFEKWLREKLLPNIAPNSVIVMDNVSYHRKILDPVPTKYSTKSKMCRYLDARKICYDSTMRKPELFDLIKDNASPAKKYFIDELLKEHGHSVLRLPPYHCDLNPIEFAWAAVRRYIRERKVDDYMSLKMLKELILNAIKSVSGNTWKKYCSDIEKIEMEYWETDGLVENVIESLNFDVESDTETDTDSETSTMDWESDNSSDIGC